MNRILAVLFALMLVLSGCLGGGDAIEEPVENLLDTDGDGIPNVDDEDDDGDSWSDLDELNCNSDPLVATDLPSDIDSDGDCDVRDSDDDGDTWTDVDELACGSDPLVATDVPLDEDEDGTCDFLDEDSDDDSFSNGIEQLCGSDSLDATSVPADMDGDGVCDAMDDDIDGDGVANDDDFAPEDPDKSEGISGCTDATAFNYNEDAEVDDASCFTLEDAEDAIMTAFEGTMGVFAMNHEDGIQSIMIVDMATGASSLTLGYLLASITYVDDGSGYVEVDMTYPEPDENGESTGVMLNEMYKVNAAYYVMNIEDQSWSHCEYDGAVWHCTELYDDYDGYQIFNGESQDETYHLFTCADGETVLLSTVNDGAEDCADGSDEPRMEDDGRTYSCNDGSEIAFSLVNDGNEDCADGSDEENFIDSFECNDGSVIPTYYLNDGSPNCEEGEDEPYYDMDQYETSTYTCEDGTTVPLSDVNDGVDDCPDGTDENPTGGTITELFSFVCGGEDNGDDHGDHDDHDDHDGEEIPLSMVNDGSEDCDDGSDEPAYDESGEEINQYTCYNFMTHQSVALNISQVNDGTIDCDLRMDESAAAGNETERWFGWDDDEEDEEHGGEYTGECQLDGTDFEIPWSWVNDGIDDCDNGMDEPIYDLTGAEDSVITCYDDTEIALSLANDGTEDCAEGEDETTWELIAAYTCADGDTVDFEWVNDEEMDCHDGSDEPTYDIEELTDFTCDDGSTIPFSQANDGHDDCADAEDEPVFEDVEVTTFECASGDEIYLSEVNDGTEDCPGADDEPSYDPITQSEVSTYTCEYSGETIALSSVNDEEEDCEDGTDEPYYYYDETSIFTCADGEDEIPFSYVNDGTRDCQDRSDEAQYDITDESVLICNDGSEITVSQFNDGVDDCSDGSDEQDYFVCEDGSYTLPFSYINDGWSYCEDGSDESVIEDVNIVQCMGGDDEIPASYFRDGGADCESGWDEMDFEIVNDCEWEEADGWMCSEVYLDPDHEWTMLMETDENGLEMIVLTVQATDGEGTVNTTVAFDAASHAFIYMEDTQFDADGEIEDEMVMVSSAYDSSLLDELVVDTSLDTRAPPWAVEFYGEPMRMEDDRTFLCDDETESVPFAAINDGVEDCTDGSDEPVYEEVGEMSEFYCNADDAYIYLSQVNDGVADCSDSEDEDDGTGTQTYDCLYSGDVILFSNVNDGAADCEDETDEPYYEEDEVSDFPCEDGEGSIPLSYVNDGYADCQDGSDEAPEGEGHGYGEYALSTVGTGEWTMGEGETMLEVVFSSCDTFTYVSSDISGASYDLPSECGEDLARYTFDEIMNGEVLGLEFYDYGDGGSLLYLDEEFELEGWNALRLSTPSGEYADENPEVVLPAPGVALSLFAMLGAAMLLNRRNE